MGFKELIPENYKAYIPPIAMSPELSLAALMLGMRKMTKDVAQLRYLYEATTRAFEKYSRYALYHKHGNNWLKMHGKPMVRKRHLPSKFKD